MNPPVTLRLDPYTRARLTGLARRRKRTTSAVVREAIDVLLEREEAVTATSPYRAVEDLLGCVRGGRRDRSEGGGRVAALLLKRRAGR